MYNKLILKNGESYGYKNKETETVKPLAVYKNGEVYVTKK